jgi:hypothetical protein
VLIVATLRRAGRNEISSAFWGAFLMLIGIGCGALLLGHWPGSEASDRHAVERQAAELGARAMAPGSGLACLDAVPEALVDACAKSLFATPETLAVALDYIDAKLQLLSASAALADRDPPLRPVVERLRSAIEADPFGLVAHVLTTRGCSGPDCADLKLLRQPERILANIKAHALEARIGVYALAWSGGVAPSSAAQPPARSSLPPPIPSTAGIAPPAPPTTSGASGGGKFDFPSASSIPPVSIMTAEPSAPPGKAEVNAPPVPPKRPPQRKQAARASAPPVASAHPAPAAVPAQPQPAPAQEAVPETAPEPPRTGGLH